MDKSLKKAFYMSLLRKIVAATCLNFIAAGATIGVLNAFDVVVASVVNYGIALWFTSIVYFFLGCGGINSTLDQGSMIYMMARTTSIASYSERQDDMILDKRESYVQSIMWFLMGLPTFLLAYLFM